jgi:hypothetical protein
MSGNTVTEARVGVYVGGVEQAFLKLDVTGVDRLSWFNHAALLDSSWTDLPGASPAVFSLEGDPGGGRRWFVIDTWQTGCDTDTGWLVVDRAPNSCANWEIAAAPDISILYSPTTTASEWPAALEADVLAVFVR